MTHLRSHTAFHLMIFNSHQPAAGGIHRGTDRVQIDLIHKRVIDDGGIDTIRGKLIASFDHAVEQHAAAHEHHIAALA